MDLNEINPIIGTLIMIIILSMLMLTNSITFSESLILILLFAIFMMLKDIRDK